MQGSLSLLAIFLWALQRTSAEVSARQEAYTFSVQGPILSIADAPRNLEYTLIIRQRQQAAETAEHARLALSLVSHERGNAEAGGRLEAWLKNRRWSLGSLLAERAEADAVDSGCGPKAETHTQTAANCFQTAEEVSRQLIQ